MLSINTNLDSIYHWIGLPLVYSESMCISDYEYMWVTIPAKSRSRRTPFSHIERLSDQLKGQFRFQLPNSPYLYRDILLESSPGSSGKWRKVYTSPQYGRVAFKFSPSTDDTQWMTAEIRVFRKLIDYTTAFIQEFQSCTTLIDSDVQDGPERIKQMLFRIMVVERVARFSSLSIGLASTQWRWYTVRSWPYQLQLKTDFRSENRTLCTCDL